tara:strand:- start:15903 stop:16436 length:534 start_codon:yes stop_codon:yes gene_type:complete
MNSEIQFHPLIEANQQICIQTIEIITQCKSVDYQKKIRLLAHATIGQHFRHIIEFYTEFLKGSAAQGINYENRQRDLLIETLPEYAIAQLTEISKAIQKLDLEEIVTLNARFSADLDEKKSHIQSTIGRELMYTLDHAIHHLAIINIALTLEFSYIEIPKNLGVAPSTIRYKEECAH